MSHPMIEQFKAVGVPARLIARLEAATREADEVAQQLDVEHTPLWLLDDEDDAILAPYHGRVFDAIDACRAASPRYAS